MNLKLNYIYIFDKESIFRSDPFKGKVIEVTETTYVISNLDTKAKIRYLKSEFDSSYVILEEISEASQ